MSPIVVSKPSLQCSLYFWCFLTISTFLEHTIMLFEFQYHLYCNAVLYQIYHAAPLQFTVQATQLAKSVSLLSRTEFLLCPLLKYGYIDTCHILQEDFKLAAPFFAVSSKGTPHNHCIGTAAGKTLYSIPNQHEMGNIPPNLGSGWPRKSDKTWFMT